MICFKCCWLLPISPLLMTFAPFHCSLYMSCSGNSSTGGCLDSPGPFNKLLGTILDIPKIWKSLSYRFFSFLFISLVHLYPAVCGILVPWPGIKPAPVALEAWGLNHWTAREVLILSFWGKIFFFYLLSVLCSLTITTTPVVLMPI